MATFKGTATVDPNTGAFSFAPDPVSPPPPPPAPPPPVSPPPPAPPPPIGWQLGQVPFAANSPWNTPVPTNATYTSLAWPKTTGYNYSVSWDSYAPGVYISSPSDPLVQVKIPDTWGYPAGNIAVHLKAGISGATGTDGEIVIVDGTVAHNFWQFNRTGTNTATAAAYGKSDVLTGTGWGTTNPWRGAGIMAAACNELGGLIIQAETDKGEIMHALHLICDGPLVKPGFTAPAIAGDGPTANGIVQEGQRLAIPKNVSIPSAVTNVLAQKVFRALQNYGCYVCDVAGGNSHFSAQANAYDDATITALWPQMQYIIPLLNRVS